MNRKEPLVLDVVSDVVCPWCFVGKRRLEAASKLLGREIAIRWRPFELNPQIPPEGMPRQEYRIKKFGSLERSKALEQQLADVGRQVGIEFQYELMSRTPNTRRAHVLLALALEQDLDIQGRTAERLFSGYFLRGEDPGDPATLLNVAREMNIASVTGPEIFDDPIRQSAIRVEEEESYARGVSGVPSIFYGDQLIASGAQPPNVLAVSLQTLP